MQNISPEELYLNLRTTAQNDPNVIGFFTQGARGKGLVTQYSDYDIAIIVRDEICDEYKNKYKSFGGMDFDLSVETLDELKSDAAWGSDSVWNRYNYTHLKAEIDKTGEIQEIIDEKGTIPKREKDNFIIGSLDHYINQIFRSVKCSRDGDLKASHFEAAESISPLLDAVFALEGRIRPFYKFLDWELTNYPLTKLPWSKDDFINFLFEIVKTADIKTQQEILKNIEHVFRKEGFDSVFDSWEEMLPWMEAYGG